MHLHPRHHNPSKNFETNFGAVFEPRLLYWQDSVLVRLLKIFITVLVVNFIFLYFITYSIFICEEPLSILVDNISISDHGGRRHIRGRGHGHSPVRMDESHMARKKI